MIIQSWKTNEKEIQPIQSRMGSTCSSGSGTLDLIRILLLIIQYLLSNLIETWQIVERLRQDNKHLVQDQKKVDVVMARSFSLNARKSSTWLKKMSH